ncbi:MAG: hypothetical protein ABJH98_04995 [Reichenbachiella sp.]|uniref:hypothetical protein n=1 Tax=Reichenbachiella sp. TaxID=2184521 RepID=UPI003296A0B4
MINILEINYEGEIEPLKKHHFEYLPRLNDKIVISQSTGEPKVYKVMDVHHMLDEKPTVYVVSDYRSPESIIQSIASSLV